LKPEKTLKKIASLKVMMVYGMDIENKVYFYANFLT